MTTIQFREPPETNACIPGSSFKVCLLQIEQHQMAHLSRFHRWHDENQASCRPPRKALTGPFNGDTQPARAVILSDPHLASSNLGAWARRQWAAQMVNKSGRLPTRGSWREGLGWMSPWQFSLQQRRRANTHTYTCWSPDLFSRAQASSDLNLWQPAGAQCRSHTYILTEFAEGESLGWCNSARRRNLHVAWKTQGTFLPRVYCAICPPSQTRGSQWDSNMAIFWSYGRMSPCGRYKSDPRHNLGTKDSLW